MLSERRASPRVNALESIGMVLVDVPSLDTTGLLVDLSEGGLSIQFAVPIPEVSTLDIGFRLGQRRVTGTCDAIWSAPSIRAAGLRFRDLPAEDRAEIRSCLGALPSRSAAGPAVAPADFEALPQLQEAASEIVAEAERWGAGTQAGWPDAAADASVETAAQSTDQDAGGVLVQDSQGVAEPTVDTGPAPSSTSSSRSRQPEWAVRMATRHQQEKIDRLFVWRGEQRAATAWAPAVQPLPQPPADSLTPGTADGNTPAVATLEKVAEVGLQPPLAEDISRHLRPRSFRRIDLRAYVRVAAVLLVMGAATGGVLWWLHRSGSQAQAPVTAAAPPQAAPAKASAKRLEPKLVGTVEVIEGKPRINSEARSRAGVKEITGGAMVARELPSYGDAALAKGLEGEVNAVLTIGDRGVVQEVRVTHGNAVLARQVVEAVAHWRFSPYFDDFGPVSVELPVTFRFHVMNAAGTESHGTGR